MNSVKSVLNHVNREFVAGTRVFKATFTETEGGQWQAHVFEQGTGAASTILSPTFSEALALVKNYVKEQTTPKPATTPAEPATPPAPAESTPAEPATPPAPAEHNPTP